jgi:hypothetical protein
VVAERDMALLRREAVVAVEEVVVVVEVAHTKEIQEDTVEEVVRTKAVQGDTAQVQVQVQVQVDNALVDKAPQEDKVAPHRMGTCLLDILLPATVL